MKILSFRNLCTTIYKPLVLALYLGPIFVFSQATLVWNTRPENTSTPQENLGLVYAGGMATPQFNQADINGDGVADLFVYDSYAQRQFWLDGSTQFNTVHAVKVPFPIQQWVQLRDYNCDGIPDLFTGQNGGVRAHLGRYENQELRFNPEGFLVQSTYQLSTNTFTANIFVNPIDIPVIQDIDGDGDLDILATASTGDRVEHHRNQSIENTGGCGLDFELASGCYGYFREDEENAVIELGLDKCPITVTNRASLKHSGTTLFLDTEQQLLLLGELEYDSLKVLNLVQGTEGDSAVSATLFPKEKPLAIQAFNAVYSLDENGQKSYLVAPHAASGFQTEDAVHRVVRNSSGEFEVSKTNFLVSKMADFGNNTKLVRAQTSLGTLVAALSSKQNRDSTFQEITILKDIEEGALTAQCSIPVWYPHTLRDVSFTGDTLYATTQTDGIIRAPVNWNTCEVDFSEVRLVDLSPAPNLGLDASLVATDINRDNHTDLIIGSSAGQLHLYLGNAAGSFSEYLPTWESLNFPSSPYLGVRLQQLPGKRLLWLSQFSGRLQAYEITSDAPFITPSPVHNLAPDAFVGLRPSVLPLNETLFAAGTAAGGIITGSFTGFSPTPLANLKVFPNPTSRALFFNTSRLLTARVFSTNGKKIANFEAVPGSQGLRLDVAPGLYFLNVSDNQGNQQSFKIVVVDNE